MTMPSDLLRRTPMVLKRRSGAFRALTARLSLRARLALLLVVSIVAVVFLSALVAIQILERPGRSGFQETFAEQVRIVAAVLSEDPQAAERLGIRTGDEPVDTDAIRVRERNPFTRVLARSGHDIPVRIVTDIEGRARQLAFEYRQGRWAYLPYIGLPPRNWPVFVAYMLLVILGAVVIALFVAGRMARPLTLLERAIATIGPDGLPARLPEDGPAEVRQTAAALNRLTARVKAGVESRMRLVAAAGHDLRTPMTRMRLRAEFLPEDEQAVWLKDLAELDRIADSAIRLVREEVDPATTEPVPVAFLLREIARELTEIGRSVTLTDLPDDAVAVLGRPLALKRALRNLVENAATHGGGATLSGEVENGKVENGVVRLTIRDEGPGIPADLIQRAFEPFFRVDPARRQLTPGAGLGMAIAREIVEKAGGTIAIANRPTGGLEQIVSLPRAALSGIEA